LGYAGEQLALSVSNRTEYDRSTSSDPRLDAIVARRLTKDYALFDRLQTATKLA
jgi:hypothetical protein